MRIIAGNFKGKKIHLPADKKTRPLRDLVKESIFNLIENSNKFNVKISNANILDLFSGSGSFGLECISRGANKVTFVENYKSILNILKRNIESISADGNYEIIEEDQFDIDNGLATRFVPKELHISALEFKKRELKTYEYILNLINEKRNT